MRGIGAPGAGPGFLQKGGAAPPGPPGVPPGPPGGPPPPGGNAWVPGTPYEAGQSVSGDDREGRMAMLNFQAESNRQARQENRADWSDGDWDFAIEKALRPQNRPSPTKRGEWEYFVKGRWIPEGIFNDPQWQKNVYEPWQAEVKNKWRIEREKSEKWKEQHKGGSSPFQRPQTGRRPGGSIRSSRSGGGGGGGMDPAMLDMLMGG